MNRRILTVLLVVLLLVPTGALAVSGGPNISVSLPDDDVAPGQEARLTVQIMNTGELQNGGRSSQNEQRVMTARGVSVSLGANGAPIEIETGWTLLGSIPDGAVVPANFQVSVKEDAEPGSYRIPLHVRYTYTDVILEDLNYHEQETVRRTFYVTLHVEDSPQFRVVDASTDVPVGDSGTVSLTMQNVGSATAYDARVTVQSGSPELRTGSGGAVSRFVGAWEPGENRTIKVAASAVSDAETRSYPITAQVAYENDDGQGATSESMSAGVTPLPEQTFSLSDLSSSLRVGEEGQVQFTLTNEGPRPVSEAVVRIATSASAVHPERTEFAISQLAPGESTTVSFPVAVSDAGEAGPHQFTFTVQYQNVDDRQRQSDPLPATVDVAETRKRFVVKPVDVRFPAGSTATVKIEVTNNGDEPLSNVNAKLFVDDPLSATDDQAFAPRIAPGERVTMQFELGTAAGAMTKPYPVSMDFQYEIPEGEQKLSETYTVAAQVTEPERGGPSSVVLGGAVLLVLALLAVGVYYYRTR